MTSGLSSKKAMSSSISRGLGMPAIASSVSRLVVIALAVAAMAGLRWSIRERRRCPDNLPGKAM